MSIYAIQQYHEELEKIIHYRGSKKETTICNASYYLLNEYAYIKVTKQAWDYKLGNRSVLEWILDQYKEKKPSDRTVAEMFNTYKFADYKEQVIDDLLKRVCTVSVETMKVVGEMEGVYN